MIIYVDVLLFINFIIDFLLLKLVSIILKIKLKTWRTIIAAVVASFFSLYIFLPKQPLAIEMLMRLSCSVVAVFISFGYKNIKYYLRNLAVFYMISFIFAGIIFSLQVFKPNSNIGVSNGIVYFNISPVLLIFTTFIIYLLITILKKIFNKTAESAERYNIALEFRENNENVVAIVDTGHSLHDAFGDNLMVIIDKKTAIKLFGESDVEMMLELIPPVCSEISKRFRLVPVKTVSGDRMMPGVKIDSITVFNKVNERINNPVAVISAENLGDDFSAIIPSI